MEAKGSYLSCEQIQKCNAFYLRKLKENPGVHEALVASMALCEFLSDNRTKTLMRLNRELNCAAVTLSEIHNKPSVRASCLFLMGYMTMCEYNHSNIHQMKASFLAQGRNFLQNCTFSPMVLAKLTFGFIKEGMKVLVHGFSESLLEMFRMAKVNGVNFTVYVSECSVINSGIKMKQHLDDEKIVSFLISDAAIGYIMERIDFIVLGTEALTKSGGIIGYLGTYAIAVLAHHMGKKLFAITESYKFIDSYPLYQIDVLNENKYENVNAVTPHPLYDYTPPELVTLHFTDLGILTPAAAAEEIIKLYG